MVLDQMIIVDHISGIVLFMQKIISSDTTEAPL